MLAQFTFDCITVIETQGYLSRAKIRHALSIGAPLGTRSEEIDGWCSAVCDILKCLPMLNEVEGTFYYIQAKNVGTNVADDASVN
jgi:hypothetical protein